MTHWGWYWKVKNEGYIPKAYCSSFIQLDSFEHIKVDSTKFKLESESIKGERLENHFRITFTKGKNKDKAYKIPIEKQTCNFGGYRFYVRCPSCNTRMRKLYCCNGYFLCRKCLNLGYYSQASRPYWRLTHGASKIIKKLENLGGSLIEKPKWMRLKTYEKLKDKHSSYYWDAEKAYLDDLEEFYGINYY
jgi:hypothetical protein